MRRAPAALAALALLLLPTGCGERSEPTGSHVPLYPVTVQGTGSRPVTLRAAPHRIAAVAPGPAAILKAIGAASLLTDPGRTLDASGRILIRKLARQQPSLIAASPSTDAVDLARLLRATHVPVYVAPERSIRDVERATSELGLLADRPIAARRVVQAIERRRRAVAARLAGVATVSVFVDIGFFTTISDRSLIGSLVREAHGRNIAGPSPEPGPFDFGRLAQLNPDVYLTTSDSSTTLRSLRASPRTRGLTAVRSGRFGSIPSDLLQAGPRIGEGLEAVARLLHPDAFR